jgi:hypothetical protein
MAVEGARRHSRRLSKTCTGYYHLLGPANFDEPDRSLMCIAQNL